jgi:hypothetical protein
MKQKTTITPADTSKESIMRLLCIVKVNTKECTTQSVHFNGTLEERLHKYRTTFLEEWSGFRESVITETINDTLDLGPLMKPVSNIKPMPLCAELQKLKDKIEEDVCQTLAAFRQDMQQWTDARSKQHPALPPAI